MPTIWKEFPEINRKVAFLCNFESPSMPLGCHAGSISGVTASFGNSYYAANEGKNIFVLDTKKEKQFPFVRVDYGSTAPPPEEHRNVVQHLKKINLKFTDFGEDIYLDIIKKCSYTPLWVMSDVINMNAPARKTALGGGVSYEMFGSTRDFAKYLIDNKIGYVLSSPIIQNPGHRSDSNYSLNQGWFWIPPDHLKRAINAAEVYGDDNFPSQEAWIETIRGDLGASSGADILKTVLNDGVFPEPVKVFRGSDGRFKRKVALTAA
jgi:hypothetical protein